MRQKHIKALRKCVASANFHIYNSGSLSPAEFSDYGQDRSGLKGSPYTLLIFPTNTAEVSAIIHYCYTHKLRVLPSGGRTGLCGGAVARQSDVVISLQKMRQLLHYDPYLPSLHVQAGMITADVQQMAEQHGFCLPLDLAASGSSHIGGNIATNAGGTRFIRYGSIRHWVMGLGVVTGKGEILRFPGRVLKNNTGYDFMPLFIGQEGSLGIITEVIIRLAPRPLSSQCFLLELANLSSLLRLLRNCQKARVALAAFEYWDESSMEQVCHYLDWEHPFANSHTEAPESNSSHGSLGTSGNNSRDSVIKNKVYALMEYDYTSEAQQSTVLELLQEMQTTASLLDVRVAQNSQQTKAFWKYREGISESLSTHRLLHKLDISLPIARLPRFVNYLRILRSQKFSQLELCCFGHIGDGNLHLNLYFDEGHTQKDKLEKNAFHKACQTWDKTILPLIARLHGSISAEHGIGLLKKNFLPLNRSLNEIKIMHKIKKILDPRNILNPGKVL